MSDVQPQLFLYPSAPHQRKHGPGGYENYESYKDWLRDEFSFRCVYCLEREMWDRNRSAAFSVDHVKAQADYPELVCDYKNLVYACVRCNSPKQRRLLLDPTAVAFHDHLRVGPDGAITALTVEGQDLIDQLSLDEPSATDVRCFYLQLLEFKRQFPDHPDVERMFREAFGFPDDLPDLESKREPSNSRPGAKQNCYHRQRAEGRLPALY
jgi:5-methylcytosine-specific restriction endonuclease McrA